MTVSIQSTKQTEALAAASSDGGTYTVRAGDTLSGIAAKSNVSLEALLDANPQHRANPNLIHPGDTLTIPAEASRTYTVQAGDSLSGIAGRNQVSVDQLLDANPQYRANPNLIHPGEVVRIPAANPGGATPPATPPPVDPPAGGPPVDAPDPIDPGTLPVTGNAFIDSVSADAVQSQQATGVPASVTIAQAILESGWGRSGLARQGQNYFGIKGQGPAGSVTFPTREYLNGQWVTVNAEFRAYDSAAESFIDHGNFFHDNSRYSTALQHTDDAHRFAREIHAAGYATDPGYSDKLISIINEHGLTRFDDIARAGGALPNTGPGAADPATSGETTTYVVRATDTLGQIADSHGVTVEQIAAANGIDNPNLIYPGQRLNIPASGDSPPAAEPVVYTVRAGDTLGAIAERHGTTWQQLAEDNGLANPNMVYPGQRLVVSGGNQAAPPSDPPAGNRPVSLGSIGSDADLWVKSGADIDDLAQPMVDTLDDVVAVWADLGGPTPVITSGNDSRHRNGSFHYRDLAIDLRANNISDALSQRIADELASRLGNDYDVIFEHFPGNTANDHIHIEYDPN